jgi:hypothetical protein
MNRPVNKLVVAIVRPPLLLLGFVFKGFYSLLFSGLDRRLALKHQQQLQSDVLAFIPSLASRPGMRILMSEIGKPPPPFDYAEVTIAVPPMQFHFVRGRGGFDAYIGRDCADKNWHELSLVLSILDFLPEMSRGSITDPSDVERALQLYWDQLSASFSDEQYSELKKQLAGIYAHDRVITKQWETEINRRLYGDKQ